MAEDCPVVRFSRDQSVARIETLKQQNDSPDKFPETHIYTFDAFYVVCIALSIITYIVDLILASVLLYFYYINENGVYFALTLTFVILPALFMTTFSLRWYIVDHDDPTIQTTSLAHWVVRIVFLLLQLAPLLRYIDTLIYGIKSKIAASTDNGSQQMTLYRKMLDEDTNGALLRLFHCFLHAAPQAIIQLMILLTHVIHPTTKPQTIGNCSKTSLIWLEIVFLVFVDLSVLQAWSVIAALISIAWSLTSYHRTVRFARDDKDKIKWVGLLIAFCWQLMSACKFTFSFIECYNKYYT